MLPIGQHSQNQTKFFKISLIDILLQILQSILTPKYRLSCGKNVITLLVHDYESCLFPSYSEQPDSLRFLFVDKAIAFLEGKHQDLIMLCRICRCSCRETHQCKKTTTEFNTSFGQNDQLLVEINVECCTSFLFITDSVGRSGRKFTHECLSKVMRIKCR